MDNDTAIQRIAEILDLPTAPSDDQVSQLADVLTQVHDAGYTEGQRHTETRFNGTY